MRRILTTYQLWHPRLRIDVMECKNHEKRATEHAGGRGCTTRWIPNWLELENVLETSVKPSTQLARANTMSGGTSSVNCSVSAAIQFGCSLHFSATTARISNWGSEYFSTSTASYWMCVRCASVAMHPFNAELRRREEFGKAVEIGPDVWVGGGAIILPGVRIGSRAVIGAGSVVTRDVPEGVFAAGNPCRVIREITE